MKKDNRKKMKKGLKFLASAAILGVFLYSGHKLKSSVNTTKNSNMFKNKKHDLEEYKFAYPVLCYNKNKEQWTEKERTLICSNWDANCLGKVEKIDKCHHLGGHIDEYNRIQYCHLGNTESTDLFEPRCDISSGKECNDLFSVVSYIEKKLMNKSDKTHRHRNLQKNIKDNTQKIQKNSKISKNNSDAIRKEFEMGKILETNVNDNSKKIKNNTKRINKNQKNYSNHGHAHPIQIDKNKK